MVKTPAIREGKGNRFEIQPLSSERDLLGRL